MNKNFRIKSIDKYFDYNATTPIDTDVLREMRRVDYVNYNSNSLRGQKLKEHIDLLHESISKSIKAIKNEVTFTCSATHSNELALIGYSNYILKTSTKRTILSSQLEHSSIISILNYLVAQGFKVEYVKHDKNGRILYEDLEKRIENNKDIFLCTIMHANNEIGVINNIALIGSICRKSDVAFHTDASQSYGKIPIDVKSMNIDMLTASGHKIYGPKGIGMLFCSRLPKRIRIQYFIPNSSLYRGNTLPNELVVGFCVAALKCHELMSTESRRIRELQLYMNHCVLSSIRDSSLNGPIADRLYTNLNFTFYGVEGESLMLALSPYVLSTGSACNSDNLEPSHVISAISSNVELVHSSIRVSLGRWSNKESIDTFVSFLHKKVEMLRACSPLY